MLRSARTEGSHARPRVRGGYDRLMDQPISPRRLPGVTVRQLWHFVAAAETGKFADAARQVHLAPSAIAKSLSELENALGVQLCVRHRAKGLVLTPSGEAALPLARNLLADLADFETLIGGADAESPSRIVVGCYSTLAPVMLPKTHVEFMRQRPNSVVEMIEESHERLQHRLLEGSIDIAFLYDIGLDPRLRRIPLTTQRPLLYLSSSHPLAADGGPSEVKLADVADENFILFGGSPMFEQVLRLCASEGVEPRIVQTCRSVGTVRAFVGRGLGVSIMYERYGLSRTVEDLPIQSRPLIGAASQPIRVCAVRPRNARPNPLTREWFQAAMRMHGERPAVDDPAPGH